MKIFLIFATALGFIVSAQAQTTTLEDVNVGGQLYDITYRSSVSFDDYQTTIDDAPWWQGSAKAFADAADTTGLRFAYDTINIGGTDYALYMDSSNSTSQAALQTASSNYAISAVAVPAPLPILGILPVVGFLKRMRKRQRA